MPVVPAGFKGLIKDIMKELEARAREWMQEVIAQRATGREDVPKTSIEDYD